MQESASKSEMMRVPDSVRGKSERNKLSTYHESANLRAIGVVYQYFGRTRELADGKRRTDWAHDNTQIICAKIWR